MENEKIEKRKKELESESMELQKALMELDRKRQGMVQRALEIKGAYDELVKLCPNEEKIEVK